MVIRDLIEDTFEESYCGDNDYPARVPNEVSIAIQKLVDIVEREMPNFWFQRTNKSETKTIAQWRDECV